MPTRRPRHHPLTIALRAVLAVGVSFAVYLPAAKAAGEVLELGGLDGTTGFRIDGQNEFDQLGFAVNGIGDVNSDGIDDFAVGAASASTVALDAGAAYVIFGRDDRSFPTPFDLDTLDGATGFRLDGIAQSDLAGVALAPAGDFNGDGVGDFMVGAYGTDFSGSRSGSTYLIFGRSGSPFPASLSLSLIDGTNGLRIDGAQTLDRSGFTAAALGDFNGDGVDDVLIGAFGATPNGADSGASYVVFGRSGTPFPATLNLGTLNGGNGFRLEGVAAGDYSGAIVSGAGDFNGDGLNDLIIGAYDADPNGLSSGSSYIVFGSTTPFPASFNLGALNGSNGFRLDGVAAADASGYSVSGIGDFNGDGFDDVVIGADGADPNVTDSGSAYIVFGRSGTLPATLNLAALDGSQGFRLDGVAAGDRTGRTSAGLGDVNGDGFGDLIIGAERADPNGSSSGSSFVVYGRSGTFPTAVSLADLDGTNGFRVNGVAENDNSAIAVAAGGDVDADGLDDILIGAFFSSVGSFGAGSAYVVFGNTQTLFGDGFE